MAELTPVLEVFSHYPFRCRVSTYRNSINVRLQLEGELDDYVNSLVVRDRTSTLRFITPSFEEQPFQRTNNCFILCMMPLTSILS